jgi:8-amino-7-oxononanoate synthase
VNFGSNDYLGLARDSRLSAAALSIAHEGWGATASPLVTGRTVLHQQLERRLAEFEGTEATLLFPSGYAANVGTIAALVGRHDAIFSDAKNHASIIDGCRLSRATLHIFPHRDHESLEAMLRGAAQFRRRLIVTESVFSMDGDLAPLVELANLAERHRCMLLVDEAHATGVFGPLGRGLVEQLGVEDRVDVRVGTLSKALGSSGGFVCGRQSLVDWLVNRARTYVFSTACPPVLCAAGIAAIGVVRDEPSRRATLLERAAMLRGRLRDQGWPVQAAASQIVPLVIGEAAQAMQLSAQLRQSGILVPAIRPPSVPNGESLLRISLSWSHTPWMIERLVAALACCLKPGAPGHELSLSPA